MTAAAAKTQPVLLLDASLQGVQAAVVDATNGRILWQGAHHENKGALEQISQLVSSGLSSLQLEVADLVGLAVGVGPGSFTGIKVGLAFIYGLRSGCAEPPSVLAVSSLEAAALALASSAAVAVALPATKTHGFAAFAAPATADGPERLTGAVDARLVDAEGLDPLSGLSPGASLVIAGEWPLLAAVATARGHPVLAMSIVDLAAAALPQLARQIATGWPAAFTHALPPARYLRLSTPEERLAQSQQQPRHNP